jgi:hypothetical protein
MARNLLPFLQSSSQPTLEPILGLDGIRSTIRKSRQRGKFAVKVFEHSIHCWYPEFLFTPLGRFFVLLRCSDIMMRILPVYRE